MDHRFDRGPHELRRVVGDAVLDAFGHVLLDIGHRRADIVGNLKRVRAGRLIDRNGDGLLVVEQRPQAVFGRAEFDPGDVAQMRHFAPPAGLHDDVAELFFRAQASLRVDGELQIETRDAGGGADHAGGGFDILRLDRLDDVVRGKPVFRGPLRINPDPHRVVAGAEQLHLADPVDPGQAILDVENRVVAQIRHVVAVVRRQQMHDHRQVGTALDGRDAKLPDDAGQTRLGLRYAVLDKLLGLVGIRAQAERHGQGHLPVGRRLAAHIEHAFDPVDLLLDRRCHRLGDHLRVGSRRARVHDDTRRHHVGIFRDRHRRQRDQAGEKDEDR